MCFLLYIKIKKIMNTTDNNKKIEEYQKMIDYQYERLSNDYLSNIQKEQCYEIINYYKNEIEKLK